MKTIIMSTTLALFTFVSMFSGCVLGVPTPPEEKPAVQEPAVQEENKEVVVPQPLVAYDSDSHSYYLI